MRSLMDKIRNNPLPVTMPGERDEPPRCEVCQGYGKVTPDVTFDNPRFGKLEYCPESCQSAQILREKEQAQWLRLSALPEHFLTLTLDTFNNLPESLLDGKMLAYNAAVMWAEDAKHEVSRNDLLASIQKPPLETDRVLNSLLFTGAPGLGKTGLAGAAFRHALPGLYVRAEAALYSLKEAWQRSDEEVGLLATYTEAPVLFLDDCQVEGKLHPFQREYINHIFRHRAHNHLPTLVTTNLSKDAFEQHWGERTSDVVFQMCHCIPLSGPKLRYTRWDFDE